MIAPGPASIGVGSHALPHMRHGVPRLRTRDSLTLPHPTTLASIHDRNRPEGHRLSDGCCAGVAMSLSTGAMAGAGHACPRTIGAPQTATAGGMKTTTAPEAWHVRDFSPRICGVSVALLRGCRRFVDTPLTQSHTILRVVFAWSGRISTISTSMARAIAATGPIADTYE